VSYFLLSGVTEGRVRPVPVQFPTTLPPSDVSHPADAIVYTTLPPGCVVPTKPDRYWFNGDPWGVCLPPDQCPPFVTGANGDGANSTPGNMTMSYFTPIYAAMGLNQVIDNDLTARCIRGHWHLHHDMANLMAAFGDNFDKMAELMAYQASWGFFISYWSTSKSLPRQSWADAKPYVTGLYKALHARGMTDQIVPMVGAELNADVSPEGLIDLTDGICALMNPDGNFPYFHFLPGYPSWQPNDMTPREWWLTWDRRIKGLAYQANPLIDMNQSPASMERIQVGVMGATMYSSRIIVPPSFDFVNFEVTGMPLLFNQLADETGPPAPNGYPPGAFVSTEYLSETASCRVNFELQCCLPGSTPFIKGGSGLRNPNGWPIQTISV
jgi:hypothetical protein